MKETAIENKLKQLRVAVAFNVKPDVSESPENEDSDEPPSGELPERHIDRFAEWDSLETINAVGSALATHHNVSLINADVNAYDRFRALRPDIVFNMAEGLLTSSRELQIPAMLDFLSIPYTGSDPLTLGIALDKVRTKEILGYHGIATPPFVFAEDGYLPDPFPLKLPVMVKPLNEGSSKGIYESSLAETMEELHREVRRIAGDYHEPAIIEEFLPGREFTVALLGNGASLQALPVVEIRHDQLPSTAKPIYGYEAKWIYDTTDKPLEIFSCPAVLNAQLESEIKNLAVSAFITLRCRDWARVDIRLDANEKPQVIEINPLPGILPKLEENSCFPKAARAAGIGYVEMINKVLDSAAERYGLYER